jgi:hypothetical protein
VRRHGHDAVDEVLALRAWAHQAHLALQHVPELGQLVHARAAQEPADPCDARVGGAAELRALRLCIGQHAAELDDAERPAAQADALLTEEDGTGGGEAHQQRDHQ